ncbi:YidB family protein [Streptomyces sp. NPDC051546]|uniref:YidB family protein n=1 Tax=Streptomyces sp. NPDC051546 TaxID=3365655 RepID=UPI0037A75D22
MSENTEVTPLGSLLAALADSPGTASKFDSWTADGANEPISGAEIAAVMDPQELSALASKAGMSEEQAAADLAAEIPPLVDAIPAATIQSLLAARQATNTLSAALQPIEATDYALETANYTQASILQQAGITVLAQVNAQPKNILPLLQQLG